jgi:hypothetical protein
MKVDLTLIRTARAWTGTRWWLSMGPASTPPEPRADAGDNRSAVAPKGAAVRIQ